MASARKDWVEHAHDVLDRGRHRAGGARAAVIALLGTEGGCLTAEEVSDLLRARGRPVAMASVYRALTLLADLGLLQRVALGHGALRYDLIEPAGGDHHHHLVCDRCGRTSSFEDPDLEAVIERVSRRVDYRVDSHDVTLRGTCPDCARGDEPR